MTPTPKAPSRARGFRNHLEKSIGGARGPVPGTTQAFSHLYYDTHCKAKVDAAWAALSSHQRKGLIQIDWRNKIVAGIFDALEPLSPEKVAVNNFIDAFKKKSLKKLAIEVKANRRKKTEAAVSQYKSVHVS